MTVEAGLPAALERFLRRRPGARLEKIHAEASQRGFFRIRRGSHTLVAMVYPEPSRAELEKFWRPAKDLLRPRPARPAHRPGARRPVRDPGGRR